MCEMQRHCFNIRAMLEVLVVGSLMFMLLLRLQQSAQQAVLLPTQPMRHFLHASLSHKGMVSKGTL